MSINTVSYFSKTLQKITNTTVIIPDTEELSTSKFPVMWLLHGLGGDNSVWVRRTKIEEYANEYKLAVVMPDVQRSFYTDMSFGGNYWSYLTDELYNKMYCTFSISSLKQQNFVCGASMGGYGALKWALTHPEKFAAVAAMSPVLDLKDFRSRHLLPKKEFLGIFSDQNLSDGPISIKWLLSQYSSKSRSPLSVFTSSGTHDFLLNQNKSFVPLFQKEFQENYKWSTGEGAHDWNLWRPQLHEIMKWLPIKEIKHEN